MIRIITIGFIAFISASANTGGSSASADARAAAYSTSGGLKNTGGSSASASARANAKSTSGGSSNIGGSSASAGATAHTGTSVSGFNTNSRGSTGTSSMDGIYYDTSTILGDNSSASGTGAITGTGPESIYITIITNGKTIRLAPGDVLKAALIVQGSQDSERTPSLRFTPAVEASG